MLTKIERFLRASGMSPTAFGRRVARDPRLVHDIRRGRVIGEPLKRRIESFIGAGR
jgi:hypothetical protein